MWPSLKTIDARIDSMLDAGMTNVEVYFTLTKEYNASTGKHFHVLAERVAAAVLARNLD